MCRRFRCHAAAESKSQDSTLCKDLKVFLTKGRSPKALGFVSSTNYIEIVQSDSDHAKPNINTTLVGYKSNRNESALCMKHGMTRDWQWMLGDRCTNWHEHTPTKHFGHSSHGGRGPIPLFTCRLFARHVAHQKRTGMLESSEKLRVGGTLVACKSRDPSAHNGCLNELVLKEKNGCLNDDANGIWMHLEFLVISLANLAEPPQITSAIESLASEMECFSCCYC